MTSSEKASPPISAASDAKEQIYAVYVQTILNAEQRRQQTTTTFVTLTAGALASIKVFSEIDPIWAVLVALVLAVVWWQKI